MERSGVTGLSGNANDPVVGKAASLRRSQRICLTVDVDVTVQNGDSNGQPERTKTLIVSAHGALLMLHTPVRIGDLLTLQIIKTQEAISCRVVDPSDGTADPPRVGVEFREPRQNFWHVSFPPSDWSPRSPEAKSYRPQMVKSPPGPGKP